jgi:hypothetical protein
MFAYKETLDSGIARYRLQDVGFNHHAWRVLYNESKQEVDGQIYHSGAKHIARRTLGTCTDNASIHYQIYTKHYGTEVD